jgi:anti-sigma factor RsiW
MNCNEFREIADSYLSDELAVETNHEILHHLENCAACRRELAARRELRGHLRQSLRNAPEFQINPAFAARLSANLKAETMREKSWFNWRIFAPVLASLLIVASIGFGLLYRQNPTGESAKKYLLELSQKAIGDHRHCALKKLAVWEANVGKVSAEKAAFVMPLQTGNTEILEAHDCIFDGKRFTHYILRRGEKVVSVMKTASEYAPTTNKNNDDSIICEKADGLQMASFQNGGEMIFVISDLTETENLNLARTLSNSLSNGI